MPLARPGRHAALCRTAGGREGAAHHAGARRPKPRGDGGARQGALTGVRQGGDAGLPPPFYPRPPDGQRRSDCPVHSRKAAAPPPAAWRRHAMKKNGARCKLHLAIYGELLYDMKAVKNGMTFGDIAQLVERCVRNAEVRGSSPLISTRKQKAARRAVFLFAFA